MSCRIKYLLVRSRSSTQSIKDFNRGPIEYLTLQWFNTEFFSKCVTFEYLAGWGPRANPVSPTAEGYGQHVFTYSAYLGIVLHIYLLKVAQSVSNRYLFLADLTHQWEITIQIAMRG